jgi:exodeoxyribonuclease VII small subunit
MAKEDKKSASHSAGAGGELLPPFEQALELLEKIVHDIECGQTTLEQSIEQYERGMKLIHHCRSVLERAETKIKLLTTDDKGQVVEKRE